MSYSEWALLLFEQVKEFCVNLNIDQYQCLDVIYTCAAKIDMDICVTVFMSNYTGI